MIKLTVLTGTDAGKEISPASDPIILGRSSICTIVLHDAASSRRHCSIERRGTDYVLTDLQSGNGTFVNSPGTRINTPYTLQDGDEVIIGKSRVRVELFVQADEDDAAKAPVSPPAAIGSTSSAPSDDAPRANLARPAQTIPPVAGTGLDAIRQPDVPIIVTVVSGPNRGMVYSPAREVFSIGRATTCDITLTDSMASRVHATIKREAGKYRLYDENSVNGVYLRTQQNRVYHSNLSDGDTIYLGQSQLRVEIHLTPPPIAPDNEDATRISGTVGGKNFTFTLSALGSGARAAQTDEATPVVTGQSSATTPEEATSVVPQRVAEQIGPKISLRVIEGKDQGTVFTPPPEAERCTIGRGEQATFRIQDRGASRIHCAIEISPAGFFLVDDGSLNGTFVNQGPERITQVALKGGEEIQVADTRLKVEITLPENIAAGDVIEEKTVHVPYRPPASPPPAAETPPTPPSPPAPVVVLTQPATENVRSRSAAFKDRLATIAKQSGITLRPFTVPGTPRQWAALVLMLLASLSSYGFAVLGRQAYFAGGPISESHAKLEQQCTSCHPTWGLRPVNATCAATDCHADKLKIRDNIRDDCVSCHTEHRGRTFAIKGGEEQCWSCHKVGLNVRAYADRPMGVYHTQVFSVAEQLVPQPGKVPTQGIQPAALSTARENWLKDFSAQPTGLKYAHAVHAADILAKNKKQEQCLDCHVKLLNEEFTPFPTHSQCIDCHKEVGNKDPQVAKANASDKCLLCHTQQDGGVTRVQRTINYVVFRHKDHGQTSGGCLGCHGSIKGETAYRPIERSAALYPIPMDACYSCHKDKKVTTAIKCLDCHRQHHSYPASTELVQGWFGNLPFSSVLLTLVGLVGAMGAYTYIDMRLARRWLASLEELPAAPADGAAAAPGAQGAGAAPPPPPAGEGGVLPYPTVDAATCISCSSCYDSCPTNVLVGDHTTHKSTVVNPSACKSLTEGCTICQDGCPTGAIRVTTAPLVKEVERPQTDQHNESNLPGVFLVGEVIGASLIKKAVNQGDQTVRYIGNRKPRVAEAQYDVIVVGAGPGGLAAGLEAKRLGLRYLILERESIASTIQNYPRDKAVLAEPVLLSIYGLLPMMDAKKETLVDLWEDIVRKSQLQVNVHEEVTEVKKTDNLFTVTTIKGSYQTAYVVLATGTRGNPRKIGIKGEDNPKVAYNLIDAAEWKGKNVLVVGGGDSAIEAAVALSNEPGTTVTLSYRRGEFSRVKPRNEQAIKEQAKAGRLTLLFNSSVTDINDKTVKIKVGDDVRELENDAIFALIGADPPKAWLEKMGVNFVIIKETVGGGW